jgi:hypothetical protein
MKNSFVALSLLVAAAAAAPQGYYYGETSTTASAQPSKATASAHPSKASTSAHPSKATSSAHPSKASATTAAASASATTPAKGSACASASGSLEDFAGLASSLAGSISNAASAAGSADPAAELANAAKVLGSVSSSLGTSDKAGTDLASQIIGLVSQGIKTGASASASAKDKRSLSPSDLTGLASSLEKSLAKFVPTFAVVDAEKAWKVLESASYTCGASPDAGTKLAGEIISQVDKSIKAGVKAAGSKEKMQLADLKNLANSIASHFAAKVGSAGALAEAEKVCSVLSSMSFTFKASPDAGIKVAGEILGQVEESLKAAAQASGIKRRQVPGLDLSSLTGSSSGLSGLSSLTGASSGLPDITAILAGLPVLSSLPIPKRELPGLDLSALTGSSSELPDLSALSALLANLPGLSSLPIAKRELPGLDLSALTGSSSELPDLSALSALLANLPGLSSLPIAKREVPGLDLSALSSLSGLSGLTGGSIPGLSSLSGDSSALSDEIAAIIASSTSGLAIA